MSWGLIFPGFLHTTRVSIYHPGSHITQVRTQPRFAHNLGSILNPGSALLRFHIPSSTHNSGSSHYWVLHFLQHFPGSITHFLSSAILQVLSLPRINIFRVLLCAPKFCHLLLPGFYHYLTSTFLGFCVSQVLRFPGSALHFPDSTSEVLRSLDSALPGYCIFQVYVSRILLCVIPRFYVS